MTERHTQDGESQEQISLDPQNPHASVPATERDTAAVTTAVEEDENPTSTMMEHSKEVAAEAGHQTHNLTQQVRDQLGEQAANQQKRAAEKLRSLADELHSMVERGGQSDSLGSQLGQQAANKAQQLAEWFEQRPPGAILDEVRDYARRHPGTFLLGAALAGAVVGRLTRGALSASRKNSNSAHSDTAKGCLVTG